MRVGIPLHSQHLAPWPGAFTRRRRAGATGAAAMGAALTAAESARDQCVTSAHARPRRWAGLRGVRARR
jgi:hypothetical protein